MKLYQEQLTAHLQRELAPIYFVSGNVPLLVNETCDVIRKTARDKGYSERERLTVETGFNWQHLHRATHNLSLFSERRIVELHLPTGKPGDQGKKVLCAYSEQPVSDILLLIIAPKIDASTQKTKWFKTLEKAGVFIQLWPVDAQQMPQWLKQRMAKHGLQATPDAIQLLAEYVEGNLLAASQEIEKLLLQYGPSTITAEIIADSASNNSRFDVFKLVDSMLAKDKKRIVRIVYGLKSEGIQPTFLLWALSREIRMLASIAFGLEHGQSFATLCQKHGIWDRRKALIQKALQNKTARYFQRLLQRAKRTDDLIKGARAGSIWDALLDLSLAMAK